MSNALSTTADLGGFSPPLRKRALPAARAWILTPPGGVTVLIAVTLAARLMFAAALGLGIDESYMVAAGRRLQLGYFDHPPIAWWLAWGAIHLFGSDCAFEARLPFVLLFALTTLLMYRITAQLFGGSAGFWAAAALNVAPVFGVSTGSWVLPDGPLLAALLGALACLLRALPLSGPQRRLEAPGEHAAWGWWLGAGACAGLALCCKYTAILTLSGAALFFVTEPRIGRRWLARPQPYAAAAVALALFLPVIVWNATHGWMSFLFQGGRAGGRFHPFGPLTTLGGEALFLLPWIWVALLACAGAAVRRGARDPAAWLLLCVGAPPILFFTVVAFWSHVLFHWAASGYLMLVPLLGRATAGRWQGTRCLHAGLAVTSGLLIAGLILVASEVQLNWLPNIVEDFAPGTDPDLAAIDWTSLQQDLSARGMLSRPGLILAGIRWHDAGKIDYAIGGAMPVICLGDDPREYGLAAPAARYRGREVLIVAPRETLAGIVRRFGPQFDSIGPLAPSQLLHDGALGMVLPMFLGHHFHG